MRAGVNAGLLPDDADPSVPCTVRELGLEQAVCAEEQGDMPH